MKTQTRNYLFNYLTLIITFVCLFYFFRYYKERNIPLNIYSYLGILIIIPSIILFTVARIQLGSSFQASAKANKLVTKGIYKKIRNPIYLFGQSFFLGLIFLTQMFYLFIIWVALIFIQRERIKKEEKVLMERFGDEYLEYKKQTWF